MMDMPENLTQELLNLPNRDWSKNLEARFIHNNRELIPTWIFTYKQRSVKNADYFSYGIPVPWGVMKQFCKEIEIKVEG